MKELKIKSIIGDNEVEVYFDYQPYEIATLTSHAIESEATINAVLLNGIDIYSYLNVSILSDYEIECHEHVSTGNYEEAE